MATALLSAGARGTFFFLFLTCECTHSFAEHNLLVGVTLGCAHSKAKRFLSTVTTLNLESVYILCLLRLPGWNCGLS